MAVPVAPMSMSGAPARLAAIPCSMCSVSSHIARFLMGNSALGHNACNKSTRLLTLFDVGNVMSTFNLSGIFSAICILGGIKFRQK